MEGEVFSYVHLVHPFQDAFEGKRDSMIAVSGIAVLIAIAAGGFMLWVWAIHRMSKPLSNQSVEQGSKTEPERSSARSNSKVEI